ncbi:hypothetical protein NECID01_1821 [Nematocida sp. AWRm77]|nr:hypothetical protein NECID01_1821 [Nematocida sp. AWRm77]
MSDIEKDIEAVHNGESSISGERLVFDRLEEIIQYIEFSQYKEGNKAKRAALMETVKGALCSKLLSKKLCTERYLFLLSNIKIHPRDRKVTEGMLELTYEAYAESVKSLLEFSADQVMEVVLKETTVCYLSLLLRHSESHHIIDLFPCFFSLTGANFQKWIEFLIEKNFVEMIFRSIRKQRKKQGETQNFTKLLYLLVSFTGTIFPRHFPVSAGIEYMHFYKQIQSKASFLLEIAFGVAEEDAVNRSSALEVIREMIKVRGYLSSNTVSFEFLCKYFITSKTLQELVDSNQSPESQLKVVMFINLLSRTIRYKQLEIQDFLLSSGLSSGLVQYLYTTNTFTVTNEICALLNELVYVDKKFYSPFLLGIIQEVRSQGLTRLVNPFAASQRKHAAHVSLIDYITPAVYILYKLHSLCMHELTTEKENSLEPKTSQKRFIVIDQTAPVHQLLEELSFLQEDAMHWYKTTRILEHKKRLSLYYLKELPERLQNSEQFSRYVCDYISSTLPEYSSFLLM